MSISLNLNFPNVSEHRVHLQVCQGRSRLSYLHVSLLHHGHRLRQIQVHSAVYEKADDGKSGETIRVERSRREMFCSENNNTFEITVHTSYVLLCFHAIGS
jgi:hypothetical protein